MSTFWITKYALTSGIVREDNCKVYDPDRDGKRTYATKDDGAVFAHIGTDAFETEEEALTDALKRVERKLRSIEKSRKKVQGAATQWENRRRELEGARGTK